MLAKAKVQYPSARHGAGEKWVTIGTAFKVSDTQINVILDTIPIRDWNGSFVLFTDDRGTEGARSD